jgi:hypothetical protein
MVMKIYNPEKFKEQIDKILNQFLEGSIVESISRGYLKSYNIPSDQWSTLNKILMLVSGTTDGRTLEAWNSVGRKIKAGTKSFRIVAPVFVYRKEYNKDTKTEEVIKVHVGYRPQPEYRYEDTEAFPNNPVKELVNVEEPKNFPTLKQISDKFQIKVKYSRSLIGEWGSYDPREHTINMKTDDIGTYFHELAHHVHGLIKKEKGINLKGGQQIDQEIVAEFSSLVLVNILGFKIKGDFDKNLGFTLRYIKGYLNTDNNETAVRAITDLISEIDEVIKRIVKDVEPIVRETHKITVSPTIPTTNRKTIKVKSK